MGAPSFQIKSIVGGIPENPGMPIGRLGKRFDGGCERLGIERFTTSRPEAHSNHALHLGGGDPMLAAEVLQHEYETIQEKTILQLHPDYQEDDDARR